MNNIDESTKNELNKLVNEFNKQNNNGLYHIDITRYKKSSYIEYKYAKDEPKNFFSRSYEGKKGWYIAYNISEVQANNDYKLQKEALDKLPSKMGQASNYLFAFSATPLFVCLINKIFLKNTPVNK
jgi:hypothetical protein